MKELSLGKFELIDSFNSYTTYFNYLNSIANYMDPFPIFAENLIKDIVSSKDFNKLQSKKNISLLKVVRLIRNAWFTESLIHVVGEKKAYIGYANHWTPVQLYYSVYLMIRSYLEASNSQIPGEHSKTLNAITDETINRNGLFILPIQVSVSGDPEKAKVSYNNLPFNISPKKISPLSSNVSFWDSYCMFLRTTRERQLRDYIKKWKKQNNIKRISKHQRELIASKLPATSFFHGVYRLRLRANYEDVDSIMSALEQDDNNFLYLRAIKKISWYTMLNFELLICRLLGKRHFERIVNEFIKDDVKSVTSKTVQLRGKLIVSAY